MPNSDLESHNELRNQSPEWPKMAGSCVVPGLSEVNRKNGKEGAPMGFQDSGLNEVLQRKVRGLEVRNSGTDPEMVRKMRVWGNKTD